jgi:hypothetical protein
MSTVSDQRAGELERYRRAMQDTLQQLDWCIGYFHGIGKRAESGAIARNLVTIRTKLLNREAQPLPADDRSDRR